MNGLPYPNIQYWIRNSHENIDDGYHGRYTLVAMVATSRPWNWFPNGQWCRGNKCKTRGLWWWLKFKYREILKFEIYRKNDYITYSNELALETWEKWGCIGKIEIQPDGWPSLKRLSVVCICDVIYENVYRGKANERLYDPSMLNNPLWIELIIS